MTKILLTGANGQLGKTISLLKPKNFDLINLTRNELDLTDSEKCKNIIKDIKPDWLINCGAYTQVDNAEKEAEKAMKINADAPRAFSEALKENGGNLLQISTDFVFNGKSNVPYKTRDIKDPINTYGYSKSVGEDFIEKILEPSGQSIILRTSWVISPFGKNFLLTMLNLHKTKKEFNVVSDQIGCPTSTFTLAKVCWDLVLNKMSSIIFPNKFHYSDAGIASWYDLAFAIGEISESISLIEKKAIVNPITTLDYPTPATRPRFSLLDTKETQKTLGYHSKHWRESLKDLLLKLV